TNLSVLPQWVSDALCTLTHDGVFAMRELNTTADVRIVQARRPVILTGITDYVRNSDLKRRMLFVELSSFGLNEVLPSDEELEDELGEMLPQVLGVLFDAQVAAMRHSRDEDIRSMGWHGGVPGFAI